VCSCVCVSAFCRHASIVNTDTKELEWGWGCWFTPCEAHPGIAILVCLGWGCVAICKSKLPCALRADLLQSWYTASVWTSLLCLGVHPTAATVRYSMPPAAPPRRTAQTGVSAHSPSQPPPQQKCGKGFSTQSFKWVLACRAPPRNI